MSNHMVSYCYRLCGYTSDNICMYGRCCYNIRYSDNSCSIIKFKSIGPARPPESTSLQISSDTHIGRKLAVVVAWHFANICCGMWTARSFRNFNDRRSADCCSASSGRRILLGGVCERHFALIAQIRFRYVDRAAQRAAGTTEQLTKQTPQAHTCCWL